MTDSLVTEVGYEPTIVRLARTMTGLNLRVASSGTLHSRGSLWASELGGLRATRSFDLHAALALSLPCPCPQHNSVDCPCLMAIVLVHDDCNESAALVAHSHGPRTWLQVVQATARFPRTTLSDAIRRYPGISLVSA